MCKDSLDWQDISFQNTTKRKSTENNYQLFGIVSNILQLAPTGIFYGCLYIAALNVQNEDALSILHVFKSVWLTVWSDGEIIF